MTKAPKAAASPGSARRRRNPRQLPPGVVPTKPETPRDKCVRQEEFWRELAAWATAAGKKAQMLPRTVPQYKVPGPPPGVVPKGEKPAFAMDQAIEATYAFAAGAGAWAGYGFMGYPLLSELAQIPEFRIPCEKLANDMTREWGKVVSTSTGGDKTPEETKAIDEKIKAVEAELKTLGVQEAFRWAFEVDGQMGQSKIFVCIDGEDEGDELATSLGDLDLKIAKGATVELRTLEPYWIYPKKYNSTKPLRGDFYKPETWSVYETEVHESRFLSFNARPVRDMLKPVYLFGGESLIQLMWVCVENWMRTRQSVSDLVNAFSTMVLSTDLTQSMMPGGAQSIEARAVGFNALRTNLGLMVLNSAKVGDGERLENVSAPLGSLDKLQAQAQEHQAAVAGIPLIVLFGLDPAGLNATGDGQIRVYHQYIQGLQQRVGTPNMHRMLQIIQMYKFGKIDPSLEWQWNPLWSMTAKENAEIQLLKAQTDQVLIEGCNSLEPGDSRKRVAADPQSGYSNIDADAVPEPLDGTPPEGETDPMDDPKEPDEDPVQHAPAPKLPKVAA